MEPDISMDHGEFVGIYSGRHFYPLHPSAADVDLLDIAHSLAHQCRFAGHTRSFYSVAQHSVLVSRVCAPQDALYGLLHDAAEAYLVDVPSPLKHSPEFEAYRTAEALVHRAIMDAFGLPEYDLPESVEAADRIVGFAELSALMPLELATLYVGRNGSPPPLPFGMRVESWSPTRARREFLARWLEVRNEKGGPA
ncbi:MAG: phosphohydrolase [bacterium]